MSALARCTEHARARGQGGWTALMVASKNGWAEIAQSLLQAVRFRLHDCARSQSVRLQKAHIDYGNKVILLFWPVWLILSAWFETGRHDAAALGSAPQSHEHR